MCVCGCVWMCVCACACSCACACVGGGGEMWMFVCARVRVRVRVCMHVGVSCVGMLIAAPVRKAATKKMGISRVIGPARARLFSAHCVSFGQGDHAKTRRSSAEASYHVRALDVLSPRLHCLRPGAGALRFCVESVCVRCWGLDLTQRCARQVPRFRRDPIGTGAGVHENAMLLSFPTLTPPKLIRAP